MTQDTWTYPEELSQALPAFGLKPVPTTPPLLVRGALNELYRFEIRRLRQRLLDGHVERANYVEEVIILRKKYWPLALQPMHWEAIVTRSSPVPSAGRP